MKKGRIFLFCLLLVLLTGCGEPDVTDEIKIGEIDNGMSLMEEYIALPGESTREKGVGKMERAVSFYMNETGRPEILYANINLEDGTYYETEFYTADIQNGEWNIKSCPWSDMVDFFNDTGEGLFSVSVDADTGIYYALKYIYNGDTNSSERIDSMYEYQLLRINPKEEEVEDISTGDFYSNVTREPKGVVPSMQFCAGDGTAAVLFSNGRLSVFNLDKRKKVSDIETAAGSFVIDENFVYIVVNNKIALFGKRSGEQEGEIALPEGLEGDSKLFLGKEGQIYLVGHIGVYACYDTADGFVQILDGKKYPVLNAPSNYIQGFVAVNDSDFYIDYWNETDASEPEKMYHYYLEEN